MFTIRELIAKSTTYLQEKGVANPRREAEEILSHVLGCSRLNLYMDIDRPLIDSEVEQCRQMLKRRALREPLSYIIGETEFYNCSLLLNSHVLIPRQETEILVDRILKREQLEEKILWDVCAGSGAVGIALKKAVPSLHVTLSDLSPEALETAKSNAKRNHVEVDALLGDLLEPFNGKKADIIVCNPPYIAEEEFDTLEPEVRLFEPKRALVAGDGLDFYRRLAASAPDYLLPGGILWLELGTGQGEAIRELFAAWDECLVEKDWGGHDRFCRCRKKPQRTLRKNEIMQRFLD